VGIDAGNRIRQYPDPPRANREFREDGYDTGLIAYPAKRAYDIMSMHLSMRRQELPDQLATQFDKIL
jgi:hypothetical protein